MTPLTPSPDPARREDSRFPLLERITAIVLLLVLLALGWMLLGAWRPEVTAWVDLNLQLGFVLAVLTASLALVSLLALLNTRKDRGTGANASE